MFNINIKSEKIVNELKSDYALAMFVLKNIFGLREKVHVLIEDPLGRRQNSRWFII